MQSISDYMSTHHRHCDDALTRSRDRAGASDWPTFARDGGTFLREIERHIELEEELLFPTFEERTGMSSGPTEIMRTEHEQMRGLFAQMRAAIEATDGAQYEDAVATLLPLLRQHNEKEESMMYPMLDQALGDDARDLLGKLEAAAA